MQPLRISAAIAVALALSYFMYRQVFRISAKSNVSRVSEYFDLQDIMSASKLRLLGVAYALPITISISVIAFFAVEPLSKARGLTLDKLKTVLEKSIPDRDLGQIVAAFLKWFDSSIPNQADPVIVIAGAFVLLYPYVILFTRWYRDRAIEVLTIYETADSVALESAKKLLANKSLVDLEYQIGVLANVARLPRPAALVEGGKDDRLLAYQIIYCTKQATSRVGMKDSINEFVSKVDPTRIIATGKAAPPIDAAEIRRGAIFYLIACAAYWYLIPKVRDLAINVGIHWPQWIAWPEAGSDPQVRSALNLAQSTASFTLPLLFGAYAAVSILSTGRFRQFRTLLRSNAVNIISMSITTGILFHFISYYLLLRGTFQNSGSKSSYAFIFNADAWAYIVAVSFVPLITLYVFERVVLCVWANKISPKYLTFFVVIAAGSGFGIAQFLTEIEQEGEHYSIHHFVLGAYLAFITLMCFPLVRRGAELAVRRNPRQPLRNLKSIINS